MAFPPPSLCWWESAHHQEDRRFVFRRVYKKIEKIKNGLTYSWQKGNYSDVKLMPCTKMRIFFFYKNWSERKMNIYWCRKVCFVLFPDSWGEGVKSNKAILRRGGFDQRFSKQAVSPMWTSDLYAPTCAIFTSRLLPLLKQSCSIGNSWTISISAWGNILLSKKCQDTPRVRNMFYKVCFPLYLMKICFFLLFAEKNTQNNLELINSDTFELHTLQSLSVGVRKVNIVMKLWWGWSVV